MADFRITIDSVLGGISPNPYLGMRNQYHAAIGVDPDRPIQTSGVTKTSGMLVPSQATDVSGAGLSGYPVWIVTNPKGTTDEAIYVYASDGEFLSYSNAAGNTETVEGTPTSGAGNGMAYYNNFIYLATPTDISRYGPLDGTPTLSNTVWTGATLGTQTALSNASYPTQRGVTLPNHPLFVHIDNKLYVGDTVTANNDNLGRGVVHWVRTKRSSGGVEGNDNDGSTYGAFYLPFGYAPTAFASWGTDLVVAAIPNSSNASIRMGNAKLFFWDAINAPSLPYKVVELPDALVTALLNHNGNLYIWTGSYGASGITDADGGTRLSIYLGGFSIKQLVFLEEGVPPIAGGVAAQSNRIFWGSHVSYPEDAICMWGYGSKDGNLPPALHNVAVGSATPAQTIYRATAVAAVEQTAFGVDPRMWMGWKDGAASQDFGIDRVGIGSNAEPSVWRSLIYPVGSPFRINKVSFPLGAAVATGMTLIPTILTDDLSSSTALTTVNNTNYASSQRRIVMYPAVYGNNNLCLQLRWSGTAILPVNLPIVIEGEFIEDATG